jgi:uncharacterized protein (TIGR03086 family)
VPLLVTESTRNPLDFESTLSRTFVTMPNRYDHHQTMLAQAHDEFTHVTSALSEAQLLLPSPCEGWTVNDVVTHIVGGAVMTNALLAGVDGKSALSIREVWSSPRGTSLQRFLLVIALERTAFKRTEPSEPVDHPSFPMTTADLLNQRIIEYVVHTWDIRRAISDHTPTDEALAAHAWEIAAPLAPIAHQLGVFGAGPSGRLGSDVTDETRLLDLTGRRTRPFDSCFNEEVAQ